MKKSIFITGAAMGIGRLTITFGKYNPMPFVLMGPPDPWVGPDILFPE
jgi:hypothetical protein